MEEALERWARLAPEEPWLFYRGERGQFRWWSFRRAFAAYQGLGPPEKWEEELPASFLERLRSFPSLSPVRLAPRQDGGRDIWWAQNLLETDLTRGLAGWAVESGSAVLLEPGRMHAELFLWARPTVVGGELSEICELFAELLASGPRWGRRAFLRRRLHRLRLLLVATAQGDLGRLRSWIATLPLPATFQVLSFSV